MKQTLNIDNFIQYAYNTGSIMMSSCKLFLMRFIHLKAIWLSCLGKKMVFTAMSTYIIILRNTAIS